MANSMYFEGLVFICELCYLISLFLAAEVLESLQERHASLKTLVFNSKYKNKVPVRSHVYLIDPFAESCVCTCG
jgi:hypothetical protein